ncbi:hypothetical protein M427DRAFT_35070 [Gonapodya prolifera JEL478]|uniref:Uncharacterized protein n=1 Tax=Gonapodya prolifera (strain JEL478) TaxID=1344416 RepID=A0A139A596_GONPJ|nr:hypothetical protein M427DRAFT_35070 [Gonapodya prolifera JEL478]|eukprot:KXS11992.1 hypothetical protein M427DRAFT_35070 [Gonapodya prolifera JEL478]
MSNIAKSFVQKNDNISYTSSDHQTKHHELDDAFINRRGQSRRVAVAACRPPHAHEGVQGPHRHDPRMDPDEASRKQMKDMEIELDDKALLENRRDRLHQSRAASHHKHSAEEKAPVESKKERRAREKAEEEEELAMAEEETGEGGGGLDEGEGQMV